MKFVKINAEVVTVESCGHMTGVQTSLQNRIDPSSSNVIGHVRIPIDGIREVRPANPDDFKLCIRLWGSGGMLGWYGLFRTSRLGKSTWYVTNRSKVVVVITGTKTTLYSPDDVNGFIAAVNSVARIQPMTTMPIARSVSRTGIVIGTLVGLAVGIGVIGFIVFAFSYAPGPPKYTLTPQQLTIHDRFYPVTIKGAAVDVDHIRIVDLTVGTDWRPTLRTNGFANSHYQSGWFRVANGQTVRLYRAGGRWLVLIPPKRNGVVVLLQVAQPEQFVEALQREWSHG